MQGKETQAAVNKQRRWDMAVWSVAFIGILAILAEGGYFLLTASH
jgi:hypothetical protein